MTSATNERQIRVRKDQARRDRITDETIVKSLMSHVDGRRWVWLRLSEAQIFVEDGDLDPYRMAYMKGVRQPALRLLRDVNRFAPTSYVTMTEENTGIELRFEQTEEDSDE